MQPSHRVAGPADAGSGGISTGVSSGEQREDVVRFALDHHDLIGRRRCADVHRELIISELNGDGLVAGLNENGQRREVGEVTPANRTGSSRASQ